jgi:hypothetical protein
VTDIDMTAKRQPDIGDRVRVIGTEDTGTIDDIWHEGEVAMASVVWDCSGCCGDGPLSELELTE